MSNDENLRPCPFCTASYKTEHEKRESFLSLGVDLMKREFSLSENFHPTSEP